MNKLTGLSQKFMEAQRIKEPPEFLHAFINAGIVRVASLVPVQNMEDVETLSLSLFTETDYEFMARVLRANGWLPKIGRKWGDYGLSISCMHREDLSHWASRGVDPLESGHTYELASRH